MSEMEATMPITTSKTRWVVEIADDTEVSLHGVFDDQTRAHAFAARVERRLISDSANVAVRQVHPAHMGTVERAGWIEPPD